MKIIAIDSSGLVASAAIVENDVLIGEYNVQYKKTHSQTLLPMLDALTKMVELDLDTVDAIALARGQGLLPGSALGLPPQRVWALPWESPWWRSLHWMGLHVICMARISWYAL